MPTLTALKSVVATYLGTTTAALTVDGVDLFLLEANNARKDAEKLHSFEDASVSATLSIDGTDGGDLSTAVINDDSPDTLTVTGTLVPDVDGTYTRYGNHAGYPFYLQYVSALGRTYFIYYNSGVGTFVASNTLNIAANDGDFADSWIPATDRLTPVGTMGPNTDTTGTMTIATGTTSRFNGIKEIRAVSRVNANGGTDPIDFVGVGAAVERERTAGELDIWTSFENRYRSDADVLNRSSGTTLIQRGSFIYIYPTPTTSATEEPLEVQLDAVAWLRDYTAADLTNSTTPDFFLDKGFTWLQWELICRLNLLFKRFVPRTEGNLGEPSDKRDAAWRDLLLWDAYKIDSNMTRSR
jgi:hypothetical protein